MDASQICLKVFLLSVLGFWCTVEGYVLGAALSLTFVSYTRYTGPMIAYVCAVVGCATGLYLARIVVTRLFQKVI